MAPSVGLSPWPTTADGRATYTTGQERAFRERDTNASGGPDGTAPTRRSHRGSDAPRGSVGRRADQRALRGDDDGADRRLTPRPGAAAPGRPAVLAAGRHSPRA